MGPCCTFGTLESPQQDPVHVCRFIISGPTEQKSLKFIVIQMLQKPMEDKGSQILNYLVCVFSKREKNPPTHPNFFKTSPLFTFVLCMFVVLQFLDQWSKSLLNLERFASLEDSDATKTNNKDKGSQILQPGLCFWQKRTKNKKKERKEKKKNPIGLCVVDYQKCCCWSLYSRQQYLLVPLALFVC
jgi:hypothetical protein